MAEKRLFKELKQLKKTHPSASNNQILDLGPLNEDESIFTWRAVIAKPTREDSAFYYNGQWKLDIIADSSYPIKPPAIRFSGATPINHPNVNFDTGEICLDILKSDGWSPAWNLEHLVLAILMLIDDPEPDSPLNVDLANLFRSDKTAFESVVQYNLWRYNTLYEGTRDATGVKTASIIAYDFSSEEEDEEEEEILFDTLNIPSVEEEEQEQEEEEADEVEEEEVSVLFTQSVQELTDFEKEISPHLAPSKLEVLRQTVAPVSQGEAYQKSARTIRPPKTNQTTQDMEKAKERFLRHIDQQVDEVRRLHEYQRAVV